MKCEKTKSKKKKEKKKKIMYMKVFIYLRQRRYERQIGIQKDATECDCDGKLERIQRFC